MGGIQWNGFNEGKVRVPPQRQIRCAVHHRGEGNVRGRAREHRVKSGSLGIFQLRSGKHFCTPAHIVCLWQSKPRKEPVDSCRHQKTAP
jgi:hypothetical protein